LNEVQGQELKRVDQTSRPAKRKGKAATKKARVKRRAVPERLGSDRRVEATKPAKDEPDVTSSEYQRHATALAAVQAWFLLPLRTWQSWQGAWARLLLR